MKNSTIVIISTLLVGFVIGFLVKSDNDQPSSNIESTEKTTAVANAKSNFEQPLSDNLIADVRKLQQLLQDEISARKALQQQLDTLSGQVANLDQSLLSQNIDESADVAEIEDQNGNSNVDKDWFNEQALIDSGMSSAEAYNLKVFFEQQELDRMQLRDQSIREGWDRQKYREEIEALADKSDALLNQLSDESYDAYLYASGQSNRVEVTSVLESAQAGSAGIQPGDRIISYDSKPIYSGFELRAATSAGDINDPVAVEVERDGELIEFYLTRGPLGIRMNSISVAPDR